MRRKLISWETFEQIQKDSLSSAESELLEASDVLAKVLDVDGLELSCFGESNVVYETLDGTFIRADYDLKRNHLTLENIEEMVIDRETAENANKSKLAEMVDAIINNETDKANQLFNEYIGSLPMRKSLVEGVGRPEGFARPPEESQKAGRSKSKNVRTKSSLFKRRKRILDSHSSPNSGRSRRKRGSFGSAKNDPNYQSRYWKSTQKNKTKRKSLDSQGNFAIKRNMKEWSALCENVLGYVDFQENGPALKESTVRRDANGNVVAIRIPVTKLRNEGKVLNLTWKTMMDQEWKVIRENAKHLVRDPNFCKAVAELKRHNNLSDNDGLQESLEKIISRWPSVLYLNQTELGKTVAESLKLVGDSNYDDQTCAFIAEGILRMAHDVYRDRVMKILKLANVELKNEDSDPYVTFQNVVHRFYPSIDETYVMENRMFSDLFDAVHGIYEHALNTGDHLTKDDAESFLEALSPIVSGDENADLDLACEVAEWLSQFVESSLEGGEWTVSNSPYVTDNGDHPAMAEKARQSYAPASGFDDGKEKWQSRASEKAFDGQQWTAVGGSEVFPSLSNPYIPKPFGDYTIKGEKGVDKDSSDASGQWQSGDTWPNLQNPYVPKAETPSSYKMKNGSETDLVVDR